MFIDLRTSSLPRYRPEADLKRLKWRAKEEPGTAEARLIVPQDRKVRNARHRHSLQIHFGYVWRVSDGSAQSTDVASKKHVWSVMLASDCMKFLMTIVSKMKCDWHVMFREACQ